jgi:hypothetical protein
MTIAKKIQISLLLFLTLEIIGCSKESPIEQEKEENPPQENISENIAEEVNAISQKLWSTSPLLMNSERSYALAKIQDYADLLEPDYFEMYLVSTSVASELIEKETPILFFYRSAFDRVLDGIKNEKVEEGSVTIWMLYNMGYIFKTTTGCFAIDITHRWAKELAPYIDFLCITHKHSDHYSNDLIHEMFNLGKPVLSNYLEDGNYQYTSKEATNYNIGNFKIRTSITNHNHTLINFMTVFQIDCGEDADNFRVLHVGDTNFKPEQFTNVDSHVDVLILRFSPVGLAENNIIGDGYGQVRPDYALLSHVLELAHTNDGGRKSVEQVLERASYINCENTSMPFGGEELVWKNGVFK